jgi:homoserine dehydrogenase
MMKVALIGLGSVGRGVAGMIAKKDLGISITGIADSQSGFMNSDGIDIVSLLAGKTTKGYCGDKKISANDVIKKADYDALIEVTPTNALSGEPAIGHIKTALLRKKHVVPRIRGR